jgi:hypothetical protein
LVEEKVLKDQGEGLAKLAVENGVAQRALTTLYKISKTRSMPFVEAFIKRQIGRRVRGYYAFGNKLLDLLGEYKYDKMIFQKILMYACMLYDYYEMQPTIALRDQVEPLIKKATEMFGYEDLEIRQKGGYTEIIVMLSDFRGNPRDLALKIEQEIRGKISEASKLNFKVWIQSSRGR